MARRGIFRVAAAAMVSCLRGGVAQYDSCTNGTIADIGNGLCDAANNNPSCGYDGGDCCPCTCADGPAHSCADSDFNCIFPECDDTTASSSSSFEESPSSTCATGWVGDGFCSDENNNASCDYDGGNCCGCTCDPDLPGAVCGSFGFDCRDPACFDPAVVAEFPDCDTGGWLMLGDGKCQAENNNPSCGYDAGDCCACTCSGSVCATNTFDCLDPDVGDEFYECKAPPTPGTAALPCSVDIQRTWVVDNSSQAQALAAAVNCSGGSFEAEWRGSVVVDGSIYIADGTVLTVTGVGPNALMNGNASTRLFTVVNAALHVSGVTIGNGSSAIGGAIAATGSSLTFNQTDFVGNRADGNGGAVYVSGGSSVSCAAGTFASNSAGSSGGAMYVTGSSVVSCGGSWYGNVAGNTAGALRVDDGSSVSWNDDTIFGFNVAERSGGAVFAFNGSSVSWNASATLFYSNSAWFFGGAVYIHDGSSVSWIGATTFDSNNATGGVGGALAVTWGSRASWSGVATWMNNVAGGNGGGMFLAETSQASCSEETTTTFSGNSAPFGGALSVESNSIISFRGDSSFDNNSAIETAVLGTGYGGAVNIILSSTATWDGVLAFTGNTAVRGGALLSRDSSVSWRGSAVVARNSASELGGALYETYSSVSWTGQTKFLENSAAEGGGGFYALNSSVSWSGETYFSSNSASETGGAFDVYFSSVSWSGETEISNNTGGALHISSSSTVSWNGNTTLSFNHAVDGTAGAVTAVGGSRVFWSGGGTRFIENVSNVSGDSSGGALYVAHSEVSWTGDTDFVGNSCFFQGSALRAIKSSRVSWGGGTTRFTRNRSLFDGTLSVSNGSRVSWSGATEFVGNTADASGGAVYMYNGAHVSWTGDTRFTSNKALTADGGAIATTVLASESNAADSTLVINGTTTFSQNTAGASGGGLALLGACTLTIGPAVDVSFVGNSAAVSGGAIFLSGTNVGPAFTGVNLVSNSAEIGGAVSIFGSGTKQPDDFSTTFDQCRFIDNRATGTGGAINSAAGKDTIFSSVFEGNSAGTGGALRLAGTASIYDCSFVENTSDDGEGAAVSNIGFIARVENISFDGNRFDCPSSMFQDYNTVWSYSCVRALDDLTTPWSFLLARVLTT